MKQERGVSEKIDGWVEHTLVPDLATFLKAIYFKIPYSIPNGIYIYIYIERERLFNPVNPE